MSNNNDVNLRRVRTFGNGAVNAARNGNIRSVNSNLGRMNNAAVNNNRPLTPAEARRILNLVNSTNRKINGIAQSLNGVRNTLAMPLKKNTFLRFTANNSRG
jgi:hypothetical protein